MGNEVAHLLSKFVRLTSLAQLLHRAAHLMNLAHLLSKFFRLTCPTQLPQSAVRLEGDGESLIVDLLAELTGRYRLNSWSVLLRKK